MYTEPASAAMQRPFFRSLIIATTAVVANAAPAHSVYSLCAIYLLWSCMRCECVRASWRRVRAPDRECYLHVHFQLSGIKQGIKAHFNVVQNHRHELAQKYNYEYMSSIHINSAHILAWNSVFTCFWICEIMNTLGCVRVCAADVHKTESNWIKSTGVRSAD